MKKNNKTFTTDFMPFRKQLNWFSKFLGFRNVWKLEKKEKSDNMIHSHEIRNLSLYWFKIKLKTYKK